MAETKATNDDGAYWLPAHFLTDDAFLVDAKHLVRNSIDASVRRNGNSPKGYCDPFSSSPALLSPVESVVSSTETDSDLDDFLTELTRHLAESSIRDTHKFTSATAHGFYNNRCPTDKPRLLSSSPQSTLNGFEGWSERSYRSGPPQATSPTTPLGVDLDAWELIAAAAEQVARLKMNAHLQQNRGLPGDPQNHALVPKTHNIGGFRSNPAVRPEFSQRNQYLQVKQPVSSAWGARQLKEEGWYGQQIHSRDRCGGNVGDRQSAWSPAGVQHHPQRHHQPNNGVSDMRAVFLGGSAPAVKKCTGTGVFLPRRPAEQPRKKPGCSTVLVPARVAQALNLDREERNGPSIHPSFTNGFIPDRENSILVARTNSMMAAQQKQRMLRAAEGAMMMGHETRLPQEWSY